MQKEQQIRASDKVMIEVQADIKQVRESQQNTQSQVVAITTTLTAISSDMQMVKRGLFGSEDFKEEGVVGKIERHEQTIKIVNTILSNAKFIWGIITFLGISTVVSLVSLIKTVFAK